MRISLAYPCALALGAWLTLGACGGQSEDPGGTGGASTGGSSTGGSSTGGSSSEATCNTATDCAWGEIDHEILSAVDCLCLFGCPSLPLNQTTVDRRLQQYLTWCDPNVDGQGNPCPIDECMMPPELQCTGGICTAPPSP